MIAIIENFLLYVYSVLKGIAWTDIVDILIISYLVYKLIKLVRETRAEQLLKGILFLVISYALVSILDLKTLKYVLRVVLNTGLVAIVVLFQPEIRRILEKVGRTKVGGSFLGENNRHADKWEKAIPIIVEATEKLSETSTGALIVLERTTKLGELISTGVEIDARPSVELFGNIFYNKTPLHDGAVIMRDGRVLVAACYLPKPQKEELIESYLGSRHRAAIGLSEVSDSVTIVVSEETGAISIAFNGRLERGFTKESLSEYLKKKLLSESEDESKKSVFKKGKKK